MAGIYIHIPFCEQFCTYCNFYSVKGVAYRDKFILALKREIEIKRDFLESAATIYMGGGTPSVLSVSKLREIMNSVTDVFCNANGNNAKEVTLEVNPDDITYEYACGLVDIGFNRVSMGVQSFVDEHLIWMNRRHRSAKAIEAYNLLRDAGIENISLDLIFGYDSLTMEQWKYNLERIIELAPEHVSAYQMSVEPGSALSGMLKKGDYILPDDNICIEQYKMLQQMLCENGYEQYEISNFARKGYYSQHNSSYWDKTPYLGLGPSAHSFDGKRRLWNTGSIKKYCDYYLDNNFMEAKDIFDTTVCSGEILLEKDIFNESLMLGLRTVYGVDTVQLNSKMLNDVLPVIKHQVSCGNLIREGSLIKIPIDKLFVSDSIIRELFV